MTLLDSVRSSKPARPAGASCHDAGTGGGAGAGAPVIAMAGAPNVGKSTLFNALTGAKRTVGNWPGTTVEVGRGVWRLPREVTVVDLPGAYSLDPHSPDEELTRDLLVSVPRAQLPDVVIVTVDAAHLARSLYLVAQVRELPVRVIVAVTMSDIAARRGLAVDTAALADALGAPVVAVDPRHRQGLDSLAAVTVQALETPVPAPRLIAAEPEGQGRGMCPGVTVLDSSLAREDERFAWIESATDAALRHTDTDRETWSDRADRWVTAPIIGPLIFLAVMWLVFQITTTVAAPLQDWLDALLVGPVSDTARSGLGALGLGGGWIEGLLVDGLIAGVGMLLTFVPLMTLMFLLLAILEDSGYMARAAVVTDRMMRAIGLPGRAFLPLVVGFGCNVPAISATRILPDARHRLLTALLVPFTSCTARLTVYVLVGTTFFGRSAGTVVFAMYLVSILFVIGVGLLLRRTLWRAMGSDPLVLDLPPYQAPTARISAAVTWMRLKGFLRTAGGIIVATVVVIWCLQATPVRGGGSFGDTPVEDSAYGVAAQAIAPAFEPAGFGQWQTASTLAVGFVAKEAVISSWAQTYATDEPEDLHQPGTLGDKIRGAFEESSGGHPIPAALAFLVFLLAYTPCVATLAAQRREIGMRWTAFGVGLQLVIAWIAAVAVFQIGRLFV